jgi:hypothetical protein
MDQSQAPADWKFVAGKDSPVEYEAVDSNSRMGRTVFFAIAAGKKNIIAQRSHRVLR